jgi:[CysO sulfur-carrier protein]-thiocarboxylate-dependent cysteine synthase
VSDFGLQNRPCGGRYADIVEAIGNTPLVELKRLSPKPGVRIYAKLESYNPTGSVKDRVAKFMIESAEEQGAIRPGQTILEPTSGNTGISLAMICQRKGYPLKVVMPDNVTQERTQLLLMYGAEIVYSPGDQGSNGAVAMALDMAEQDASYYMPYQYGNAANPRAHYEGTAVEILQQTGGHITHFVAGLGTTGTFVGTSRRLKEHDSSIHTIALQPEDSFHGLEGLKHIPTAIVPKIWDPSVADEIWGCPTEPAYDLARAVARTEGLLVGHSSGAALWAAQRLAATIESGVIVTVFPDSGDRYISTGLYGAKP